MHSTRTLERMLNLTAALPMHAGLTELRCPNAGPARPMHALQGSSLRSATWKAARGTPNCCLSFRYRTHMSYTPSAKPTGCQATIMREMARTLLVSCSRQYQAPPRASCYSHHEAEVFAARCW